MISILCIPLFCTHAEPGQYFNFLSKAVYNRKIKGFLVRIINTRYTQFQLILLSMLKVLILHNPVSCSYSREVRYRVYYTLIVHVLFVTFCHMCQAPKLGTYVRNPHTSTIQWGWWGHILEQDSTTYEYLRGGG